MCLGKRNCSACNAGETGLLSWRGGSLKGFLELRQAPGVYSRVMTGMPVLNGNLFSESGHLSKYDGHLGKLN